MTISHSHKINIEYGTRGIITAIQEFVYFLSLSTILFNVDSPISLSLSLSCSLNKQYLLCIAVEIVVEMKACMHACV